MYPPPRTHKCRYVRPRNLDQWRSVVSIMRRSLLACAALLVLVSACTSGESTVNTYADESGWLWYETDCPNADVLLLAGADGLPAKETTEREAVEAFADGFPEYRAIPRNGWV